MDQLTLRVPAMTCDHCVAAVEAELGRVPGVEHVAVDLATKAVVVTGAGLDLTSIRAAVEEAGYEVDELDRGEDA
jgi:copper ion binding protein